MLECRFFPSFHTSQQPKPAIKHTGIFRLDQASLGHVIDHVIMIIRRALRTVDRGDLQPEAEQ